MNKAELINSMAEKTGGFKQGLHVWQSTTRQNARFRTAVRHGLKNIVVAWPIKGKEKRDD